MSKISEVMKPYSRWKSSVGDAEFKLGDGIEDRFCIKGVISAFANSMVASLSGCNTPIPLLIDDTTLALSKATSNK